MTEGENLDAERSGKRAAESFAIDMKTEPPTSSLPGAWGMWSQSGPVAGRGHSGSGNSRELSE